MTVSSVYESVAELLPDDPILASKDPTGPDVPAVVDAEVTAFHREVFQTGPLGSITSSCLPSSPDLPRKHLNPGRPKDLFWLFESSPGNQSVGSYATFKRVWREHFADILRFRPFGTHACCTDCSLLQAKMRSARTSQSTQEAGEQYRAHLRSQWRDRQLYAKARQKSKEKDGDLLTLIVDGADQARFRVFKCLY